MILSTLGPALAEDLPKSPSPTQLPAANPQEAQAPGTSPAPSPVEVNGTLLEKGTRRVLPEITVYIREIESKTIVATLATDEKGMFHCRLKPGSYTAIIAAIGYDKLEEEIEILSDVENTPTLRLVPVTINPYQIIVRSKKRGGEVSNQQLSPTEANQIPGTNRDVLSSISNLPGVNSVSVFNGYGNGLVIRGSSQEDSLFLVNGHSLDDYSITGGFYHFGGLESIIEPELIESIDYMAGGFSAEYGNSLGGVVSLEIKDPRTDRFGGYANLGLLSTSFMLEGPIGEKDSFAFSLKRGFLDSYVKIIEKMDDEDNDLDFVEYPNYYDGTAIYRHSFANNNDLKLTAIGKNDSGEVDSDVDTVSERSSGHYKHEENFITMIGEWDYKNDDFHSILSPRITYSYSNGYFGERAYHKQSFDTYELNEKIEYQWNPSNRLKGGIGVKLNHAKVDSNSFVAVKEGEIRNENYDNEMRLKKVFNFYYPSLFFMDQIQIGQFTLTPGIHASYDSHNAHELVDPRMSLKYQLTETTALKAATGLYSKMPLYDECVSPWGTKGLSPEKSIHGVAGVEHQLGENLTLDVQTFYKSFYDMVVKTDDLDPSRYGNEGSGHAYGAEILLRHQMTDHFFGWISYTYSVAKRKDGPGEEERYFDSDIPHNFTTVLSYKPNRYWSFGLKYQYASGLPYTDLLDVETLYVVDRDEYYPVYDGPINNNRLKPYRQLDFRIDKYWIFNNFILSTYLDVRNVLQTENVVGKFYNQDYTQSDDVLSISSYVPLIFLGVKFDF